MGSFVDHVGETIADPITVYGLDTETYNDNGQMGLKSIQIWNPYEEHYFIADDYNRADAEIRTSISSQLFTWINALHGTVIIAFFNMDFDFSQFSYDLVHNSPWKYDNGEHRKQPKGTFSVLESDTNIYKCQIRTETALVTMLDISNFLTATSLNKACEEWIGDHKIEVESKVFPKAKPTEIEKEYAMKDAELTCKLWLKLDQEGVVEGTKYSTIAGRTMGHFKDFLKKNYGLTFEQFCYGTDDKDTVEECNLQWESVLRPFTRGGIVQAFKRGHFKNCHHIDARSMYPTQCVRDRIPFGPVLRQPPKDKEYTTIYYPKGHFYLREGKISGIQFRRKSQCLQYSWLHEYEPSEYVQDMYLDGTFPIWEAEYEIVKECFECDDLDDGKRVYVEMVENVPLKAYIRMLYKGKSENTGTKKYFHKILMNALYGKFLSRPDGVAISYENGERVKIEELDKKTYYLPLGNWIAMMGRVTLMKCLLSIPKENLLYCDTDSCIYIGDVQPNVNIGKDLGDWGIENDNFQSWIVGCKTYQELNDDGTLITKCAGLDNNVRAKVPFMDLAEGKTYDVHKARRDPITWAINILPITFKISTKATAFRR